MEITGIKVRPAKIEDAQDLARIHIETWKFAYKGLVPAEYLDNLSLERWEENWRDILSKSLPDRWTLVAESEGKIAGFCGLGKSRDEDAEEKVGEVISIYVGQNYMDKGVGSSLMNEGLKLLKDQRYTKATLWVLENNEKAKRFYESKGWVNDERKKTVLLGGAELCEIRYSINL